MNEEKEPRLISKTGNEERKPRIRTKTGNVQWEPRLRANTKDGKRRISKDKYEEKGRETSLPGLRKIFL